jgi:hypothetical protein
MPPLNWTEFGNLPGRADRNFEALCSCLVRHNYGSYGVIHALANQPGVEFHVRLERHCVPLGDPPRWWGWQCKWYELDGGKHLNSARRAEIKKGIQTTEKHLPELTDWVLWTREILSKKDQDWFYDLSSKMELHLWSREDVDRLLTGSAEVYRQTFFGEWVLTPQILRERHENSVASIRTRWQPHVHQVVPVERELRRMLGEINSWEELSEVSTTLRSLSQQIESSPQVPNTLAPCVQAVINLSTDLAKTIDNVLEGLGKGDFNVLRDEITAHIPQLSNDVAAAPRRLRAGNHRVALCATNAVAECRDALHMLAKVEHTLATQLVVVVAAVGCGKTQLAAELTSDTNRRPHGILLHGRNLHATQCLDDLARKVTIGAKTVPNMDALLAAVEAAGQRAQHRLPICIDGLNEAEDPRIWKQLLCELQETLKKYPYVLVVCTLRPQFLRHTIPSGVKQLQFHDYAEQTEAAIREHFTYWKIDATDALLPGFLRHPLTLRLYCEVTNSARLSIVRINPMLGSLTVLFDRFLDQIVERIVESCSREHRFDTGEVETAISLIAARLWETGTSSLRLKDLRTMLDRPHCNWDKSIVHALENEGILLRISADEDSAFILLYDLLAGHIIAKTLLARHPASSFAPWIRQETTTARFTCDYATRHPLADDILRSLVEQVPRELMGTQLWQLVDESLRELALRLAAGLEPTLLDQATVDEVLVFARNGDTEILNLLKNLRGAADHPLNAIGLDRLQRTMTVAERDLGWTEWLRRNHTDTTGNANGIIDDLERLEQTWRTGQQANGDRLRAFWVMWTLTSTVRELRDQATRTLYWFGRVDPEALFDLALRSLSVNDAYVSERMLAAAYGVVTSHQNSEAHFGNCLTLFLDKLAAALIGSSASVPTLHYLVRLYVRGIAFFAKAFYPAALPQMLRETWSFSAPRHAPSFSEADPQGIEASLTLSMDFMNYTLGRLFVDRSNYDMNHVELQKALDYVRGVLWEHGWRAETFLVLDRSIAEDVYRYSPTNRPRTERYGKKYSWIGFFNYASILEDQQRFLQRNQTFSQFVVDPTFPDVPPVDGTPTCREMWLSPGIECHMKWTLEHKTEVPHTIIFRNHICGHEGPWIAVHGFLRTTDKILGREVWAFLSALVTRKTTSEKLVEALNNGAHPTVCRDVPSDYYTFSGEIPWHPEFGDPVFAHSPENSSYEEIIYAGDGEITVEILAHRYVWESSHSVTNGVSRMLVPSRKFSREFGLFSIPQKFGQCLPDGTLATITLSGVDGLEGDILYVREQLLRHYIGGRTIVWHAFGGRELRPFPSSSEQSFMESLREHKNEWRQVLTEEDLTQKLANRENLSGKCQDAAHRDIQADSQIQVSKKKMPKKRDSKNPRTPPKKS